MSLAKIASSADIALGSAVQRIGDFADKDSRQFISELARQFLRTFPFPTHFAHHFHAAPQQAVAMAKWSERFTVSMAQARHAGVNWSMKLIGGEAITRSFPDPTTVGIDSFTNGSIARAFNDEATSIASTAAQQGWSKSRYHDEIGTLAKGYGSDGISTGKYGAAFDTAVSAQFNRGVLDTFSQSPVNRLYPYLAYRTRGDERVRPAHRLLDKFIARSTWTGWIGVMPPNGFRCRCVCVPVPAAIAKQARYTGDFPLGGALRLSAWQAAGGPDENFPKSSFLS